VENTKGFSTYNFDIKERQQVCHQCSRCGGLMVIERFDDLQSSWNSNFYGLRCLLCGENH